MDTTTLSRCAWVTTDPLYIHYHDHEWGIPVYDAQTLFEWLILEGQQAGLSWITILKKREAYREAFAQFNAEKISRFNTKKIETLLKNKNLIRHRLKMMAIVKNAQAYLQFKEPKQFSDFLWDFVDGKPIINHWKNASKVPTQTKISECLSRELKKRGFIFVGPTICYAFMQAVGMVNDHINHCFRAT